MRLATKHYAVLTTGAALGLAAAFLQTVEKVQLLKNENAALPCDLNSVFSCSAVLSAPQSSLFGFPNSLICMVMFTFLLTVGIVGLTGVRLHPRLLRVTQGIALFMLAFALWFLATSTFVINAVCIFCVVCFVGLLLVNHALLRITPYSFSERPLFKALQMYAPLGWSILAAVVASMIVVRFYL
jgi:uncharacterized membrane protein